MLQFDERTTKLLEEAYLGADFSRRRRASFDALMPSPGDVIADIGCGNGLLTLELSRTLGDHGKVVGIDPSADMRNAAVKRCADSANVEILSGTVTDLRWKQLPPTRPCRFRCLNIWTICRGAVTEIKRILKPGGKLVVGDMHWDTITWFSDQPDRMAAMLKTWDEHLVERCIPAVLPQILREAGVPGGQHDRRPVRQHDPSSGRIGEHADPSDETVMPPRKGPFSKEDTEAWAEEQVQLAKSGRFFFSITHFVITATLPG